MAVYVDQDNPSGYIDARGVNQPAPGTPPPAPEPEPETETTASPWDTPPPDGNWQAWFMQNVNALGLTPNSATLKSLEPQLAKHGIKVIGNADGTIFDSLQLPDGSMVDVGGAFSSGNQSQMSWTWQTGGGAGPADGPPIEVNPDYLAPFTGEFSYADFQKPNKESLLADPSYQWRLDQGRGMAENSASARGVLNSGGTLYDLLQLGQGMASQEYGNVFDREFGTWNTNYANAWRKFQDQKSTWYENQDRPWQKLFQAGQLGSSAAGNS